jgi:phage host-nuclease inhibitor protein Gam
MSKNRIKKSLPTIASREEAEATLGEIALITLQRAKCAAQMDNEITIVRSKYEANLAAYSDSLKEKTDSLCAWAEANPTAFPKDRKSIQFVHGTIGFRTAPPQVVMLSRAWTVAKVLSAIALLRYRKFIRIKRELDKEANLARASAAKDAGRLPPCSPASA